MIKISYEILAAQVDLLYATQFQDTQIKEIEEHCEYIATFIEACGWSIDEYMYEYIHRGLEQFFPNLKDQN